MARGLPGVKGKRGMAIGVAVAVAVALGLAAYGGVAAAEPQPTVTQAQAQVNKLQAQVDQVDNQYDTVTEQLGVAKARLAAAQRKEGGAEQKFLAARTALKRVAVASFENQDQSSVESLLSSGSPDTVLSQASLLQEMARTHSLQAARFQSAASQVLAAQAQFKRTEAGVAQLQSRLAAKKQNLNTLLAQGKATLDSLTLQQQRQVAAATIDAGGVTSGSDPLGTGTSALKAVSFVYQQLGKPYLFGGTGPDAFDCSGLMQAAWASAGVSIPRDTYQQWASLPHVAKADLQPGDIVFFESEGHDGMYIGNGMLIDAPHTGEVIRKVALDGYWYAQNYDGAVRP